MPSTLIVGDRALFFSAEERRTEHGILDVATADAGVGARQADPTMAAAYALFTVGDHAVLATG